MTPKPMPNGGMPHSPRHRPQHLKHGLGMLAVLAGITAFAPSVNAGEFTLPEGPNRSLIYAKCRTCHDLQYVIESKGMTAGAWDGLLDDMEGFGVELTAEERDKVFTYLSTYMADTPPPEPSATNTSTQSEAVDGGTVFMENCTSCHQENAQGIEETFPPLAENADLYLAEDFPIKVLLNGMSGTIEVNGQSYEGEMPPFSHLPDEDIAAVITYLRDHFGNTASDHPDITPVTPDMVKALRDTAMEPTDVFDYRATLKK